MDIKVEVVDESAVKSDVADGPVAINSVVKHDNNFYIIYIIKHLIVFAGFVYIDNEPACELSLQYFQYCMAIMMQILLFGVEIYIIVRLVQNLDNYIKNIKDHVILGLWIFACGMAIIGLSILLFVTLNQDIKITMRLYFGLLIFGLFILLVPTAVIIATHGDELNKKEQQLADELKVKEKERTEALKAKKEKQELKDELKKHIEKLVQTSRKFEFDWRYECIIKPILRQYIKVDYIQIGFDSLSVFDQDIEFSYEDKKYKLCATYNGHFTLEFENEIQPAILMYLLFGH